MTDSVKLSLSAGELQLVCNKDWILAKQIIIEKVYLLFGAVSEKMQQCILAHSSLLPAVIAETSPKISRGENYRGLPYVILDYPRHFKKADTLAIRTLFWWGNFFSINLHLSGAYKENALPILEANFDSLQQQGYYLCIHPNPWEHHFEEDNYRPLKNYLAADFTVLVQQMDFIKIALPIPLQQWELVPALLEQHFTILVAALLKINFPSDGKDPLPGIPIVGSGL